MDLHFSWLVNNRPLALVQLVAPGSATFSVVQPSELEDASEFIQPHSLVLTVGIAFKDREEHLAAYIDHLADAGAVAVGFGTGLIFQAVPDIVVETARRRGIGLFEVPRRIPFISIISAAHQEQRRRANRQQQQLVEAQERLTATAIAGSLDALVEQAAEILQARVTVSHGHGSVVATALSPAAAAAESAGNKLFYSSYKMTARGGEHHSIEVHATAALSPAARSVVRHCAGLADMLLARPRELRSARNELNSFALSLRLGLGTEDLLLPPEFDSPTDEAGLTRPVVLVADTPRALDSALAALDSAAEDSGQFLYSVALPPAAALVLFRGDFAVDGIIHALGSTVRRVRLAVGRRIAAVDLSMEVVGALKTRASVLSVGDYSLPDAASLPWLAVPAVAEALSQRRTELFDRLHHEDQLHGTDYARTLTVFLRHGGQLAPTAMALGVHRHTVRNRMSRIQDLCEIDLSDPAIFAEAFFASLV